MTFLELLRREKLDEHWDREPLHAAWRGALEEAMNIANDMAARMPEMRAKHFVIVLIDSLDSFAQGDE